MSLSFELSNLIWAATRALLSVACAVIARRLAKRKVNGGGCNESEGRGFDANDLNLKEQPRWNVTVVLASCLALGHGGGEEGGCVGAVGGVAIAAPEHRRKMGRTHEIRATAQYSAYARQDTLVRGRNEGYGIV